jgi:CMP-N,N'-diacetyllegionaminic acid synthase
MSNLFAIIPARSGSVGVPDKNIAVIGGVPLLVQAYRVARSLPLDVRVIVSTDSEHYLALLRSEGYSDPALRPIELATSGALVIDTILHELDRVKASNDDLVVILEPSFFGGRSANIVQAIERVCHGEVDSCFGVYAVPTAFHHSKQYVRNGDHAHPVGEQANVNRQQLPPAFVRSGEFYLSRIGLVRAERSLFGGRLAVFETAHPFVNIDEAEDMKRAARIAEEAAD